MKGCSMYKILTTLLAITVILLHYYDQYKSKKDIELQHTQQLQEYRIKQLYQTLGEAVAETEHTHFQCSQITLEEIDIEGTGYVYHGFGYLLIQSIIDDIEKRSFYMKLRRNIAKKIGCKATQVPYIINVHNDFIEIIPKIT